jgi:hypothetical protein
MNQSNQNQCPCQKTSCACGNAAPNTNAVRCSCGETCSCQPVCRCQTCGCSKSR